KLAVVCRSRRFWQARLGTGEGLRSGRTAEHDPRYRYRINWRVDRHMAANGSVARGKSGRDVCRGRGLCRDWLVVECVLSNQQSVMDQFVRVIHRRPGITVPRALLLDNRYQRLSQMGQAV